MSLLPAWSLCIALLLALLASPALPALAEPDTSKENAGASRSRASSGASTRGMPPSLSHAEPSPKQLARAKRLFEQGLAAYEKGDLTAAADFLLKAHAITPSPELAYNLGRIYERMGDAPRAIPLLRGYLQSAKVTKDEAADIERRIAALEALAARTLFPLALRTPSEGALKGQARSLFEHGVTAFRNGDYEAARAAFASAHALSPLPELAYDMALAYERLGRSRDAADHFTTYLSLQGQQVDPTEVEALQLRIRTLQAGPPEPARTSAPSAATR